MDAVVIRPHHINVYKNILLNRQWVYERKSVKKRLESLKFGEIVFYATTNKKGLIIYVCSYDLP